MDKNKPYDAPKPLSPEAEAKIQNRHREMKIRRIRERLREIRGYKELLEKEGLEPDQDDKVLESDLIVQLLRLEKGLPAKAKKKDKAKIKKKKEFKKLNKPKRRRHGRGKKR